MAKADRSSATFRIFGDDLNPDEISKLLGCEPTQSQTKGQVFTAKSSDKQRTAKTGMWQLSATECEPENLDAQIKEIFQKLPDDEDFWNQLAARYGLDIFCGVFVNVSNGVTWIAPESLQILSSRKVILKLDIYAGEV